MTEFILKPLGSQLGKTCPVSRITKNYFATNKIMSPPRILKLKQLLNYTFNHLIVQATLHLLFIASAHVCHTHVLVPGIWTSSIWHFHTFYGSYSFAINSDVEPKWAKLDLMEPIAICNIAWLSKMNYESVVWL